MITVARPAPESFKDRKCIVNSNKKLLFREFSISELLASL